MMKQRIFIAVGTILLALEPLAAQTQVSLQAQSKAADFSQFASVRPLPSGTSFPGTCLVGQGLFRTDLPAGQNVFWCTSPNTWTFSQGSSGSIAICQDNSGSGAAYTCLVPSITSYTPGLTLILVPLTTNTASVTLNATGIGARPLLRATGNGVIAGELQAGNAYVIVYNGAAFVMSDVDIEPDGSGTIAINRGAFPHTIGVPSGIFWGLAEANTPTGYTNLADGQIRLPESTVASLPAASSNTGREYMVTDGASLCDTATGGGSTRVFVESNGTLWVAPNCGNAQFVGFGSASTSGTSPTTILSVAMPALNPGDAVRFTLTVKHTGTSSAWNAQISYGSTVAGGINTTVALAAQPYAFLQATVFNLGTSSELTCGTWAVSNTALSSVQFDQAGTGGSAVATSASLGSPWNFVVQGFFPGSTTDTLSVAAYAIEILRQNP